MLPVLEIEPDILAALAAGNRLVLTAPTGSGKTTQVPQILLRGGAIPGQIFVLQPRRLATRMVAQRVAQEMRTPIGETVGYQTRHDSRVSLRTRIRFMTEALLLRMLQSNPTLPGVGAVVLDEFHERNLAADIALGLLKTLQETHRPDLRLLVMSATLDAKAVAAYLKSPALEAGGRLFPVDIRYLPRRRIDAPWDLAAEAIALAAESPEPGDVLVFMPGVYEINRTIEAARRATSHREISLRPLHGSLPPDQQDAALAPAPPGVRKVVVATNVAETSLTIDGIRWVIDSGLARVHRYESHRGIDVLRVEPISRASADQRAGRAGRTAPGVAIRLWTDTDHRAREAQTDPEVRRVDLADAVLQLKSMGADARTFPWLEPPDPQGLDRAEQLLTAIDALAPAPDARGTGTLVPVNIPGATGPSPRGPVSPSDTAKGKEHGAAEEPQTRGTLKITDLGRKMAHFPAHPRLARMMLEAADRRCLRRAAVWAALISEPDLVTRTDAQFLLNHQPDGEPASDLAVRERLLELARGAKFDLNRCIDLHVHANTAREVDRAARQLEDLCRRMDLPLDGPDRAEDLLRCLLVGFPDHVAVKMETERPHCAMTGRRRVVLDRQSVVRSAGLLLAVEINEIGRGENVETNLALSSALDPAWLAEVHPERVTTRSVPIWNEQNSAVEMAEERVYDGLVIERTVRPTASPAVAAEFFVERIMSGELKLENWSEGAEQWIARTRSVAKWFPERELITYDDDDRRVILHEIVSGATRWSQIRDRPCLPALREALGWEEQQLVEKMAPESIPLPSGKRMPITYPPDGPPRGRAKIQDLFGWTQTPLVGGGRQKVTIEILAPNHRPVQVTDDLAGFWERLYPTVRNELRRKYPRHEWR